MIPIRDENPTGDLPRLTLAILFLELAVAAVALSPAAPTAAATLSFPHTSAGAYLSSPLDTLWRGVTASFLHVGAGQLVLDLLLLWVFADNVEKRLGPGRFVALFLGFGLVGALAEAVLPSTDHPTVALGSAPTLGVLGLYLNAWPWAKVETFVAVFLVRLPAWLVIFGVIAEHGLATWYAGVPGSHAHVGSAVAFLAGVALGQPPLARAPHT